MAPLLLFCFGGWEVGLWTIWQFELRNKLIWSLFFEVNKEFCNFSLIVSVLNKHRPPR